MPTRSECRLQFVVSPDPEGKTGTSLGGRTQLVQVEAKVSEPLEGGDHAVPQGSVLGGLLHVINSNDLPACHDEGESVVYVDDNSDTVSAKVLADCELQS